MSHVISPITQSCQYPSFCSFQESLFHYPKTIICGYPDKNKGYGNNVIKTTRYSLLNIVPLYLWDVFNPKHKLANVFFLLVSILQCIPSISLTNGLPSSLPSLLTIIGAEAVHMGILEYKRRKSDKETNNRSILIWNMETDTWNQKQWKDIHAGDILKVFKNEDIPCDMVLLSTNDMTNDGHCYITTTNIDGETDIKTKNVLVSTSSMSLASLMEQEPVLYCESENSNTSSFSGVLKFSRETQVEYVSISSLLLRGCRIVFTDWVVGCAVSVGGQTKIEFSTKSRPHKKESETLLLLNRCIIYLLILLLVICIGSAIMSVIWDSCSHANLTIDVTSFSLHFIKSFFVYFQLCYQIVPASLYVCVEIALLLQTFFMEKDLDCYQGSTDHIRVRNAGILDELGHVTHVLSDKTGTITENNLQVVSIRSLSSEISINNEFYCHGRMIIDESFHALLLNMTVNHSALSISNRDYDQVYTKDESSSFSEIRVVSLTEELSSQEQSLLEHQSTNHDLATHIFCSSQDERAILDAVGDFGYRFCSKSHHHSSMTIEVRGIQETVEILHFFPFSAETKRTSIIIRFRGEIMLFCKGADSSVYSLLDPNDPHKSLIEDYVNQASKEAYRTLVFAGKTLTEQEYVSWSQSIESSGYTSSCLPLSFQERIEQGMVLQGAIAIQDDLVRDVYYSIKKLQTAGIRFWILTGDKADTAKAIGIAAGVINPENPLLYLTSDCLNEENDDMLTSLLTDYQERSIHDSILVDERVIDRVLKDSSAESNTLHSLFLQCLLKADSVIISRMRKDQKQLVTTTLKEYSDSNHKNIHILCVGDGANDIGMIRESDIGIGIKGKEGFQAFNNSDIGLPSFTCLTKLLFVHGKSNEMRLQTLILYFLYKNTFLSIITLLLSYVTVFSGLKVMPSWGIDFYNTYFTSIPILTLSAIDFFSSKELLIRTPQLYKRDWYKPRLSKMNFILNLVVSIVESCVVLGCCFVLIPYYVTADAGMNMSISISYLGTMIFTIMVITANIKILFIAVCHYQLLIVFVVFSILLWYLTFAVISSFVQFPAENWDLYGTFVAMVTNPQTFLVILFCVVLTTLRPFIWKSFRRMISPSPSQIVNEMNASVYEKVTETHLGVYQGESVCVAARKVNLTIQSVLHQQHLLLRQLQSIDQEAQQVVVPVSY